MTFKQHWEKADEHHEISSQTVEKMLALAFPQQRLIAHEVISGGCANLNIKVTLENQEQPYILRVYLRDPDAAYREQKLAELLAGMVPVPKVHFVGDLETQRFAIHEFIPGFTLRDLLLGDESYNRDSLMKEAGQILAKIQTIRFPHSGFFDNDLTIKEPISKTGYLDFARDCLKHPTVQSTLGADVITKITTVIEQFAALFPDETANHLVHGDFDPANLLVNQSNGQWKISAVLDWEFAFAGSPLQDVANMLRYAHHMSPSYESAFLSGLEKGGFALPENWRRIIDLLNLDAVLYPPERLDPVRHPNRTADICELIDYLLSRIIPNGPTHEWAQKYLIDNGYEILGYPEILRAMPWSIVTLIPTSKGSVYLKEMATLFSLEPELLKTLSEWDNDSVPEVIAMNKDLRCFLMKDAGTQLSRLLKSDLQMDLLKKTVTICAKTQYKATNHVNTLLSKGVPDWRLSKLPELYAQLISHEAILREDGLTADEIRILHTLQPTFGDLCHRLSQYNIPETLEHSDFTDSNVFLKGDHLTIGDWADAVITHPFFSLASYLNSAMRYHGLKEGDERYLMLQNTYLNTWHEYESQDRLIEAFQVTKRVKPCQVALSFIRVKQCPNLDSSFNFRGYIANALREFIHNEV